jgi:hypothetical protein
MAYFTKKTGNFNGVVGIYCLLVLLLLAVAAVEETSAAVVAAAAARPQCNLNGLWPCYSAVQGTRPPFPSRSCCSVVRVVDKNCLCNALLSGSYPPQMVRNALTLPNKCGRYDLAGFKCGGTSSCSSKRSGSSTIFLSFLFFGRFMCSITATSCKDRPNY